MQLITIDSKEILCADIEQWKQFKEWVKGTKLYAAILQHSGNPDCRIEGIADDIYISLDLNSTKITDFDQFPKELLFQFYINSPWYNVEDKQNNLQKLLTDDNRNKETIC